jgi:hypothetical protein
MTAQQQHDTLQALIDAATRAQDALNDYLAGDITDVQAANVRDALATARRPYVEPESYEAEIERERNDLTGYEQRLAL